ncbi:F12A21.1 [Arabidopsis thaliana]|uniref:F12A21.1 n=1 Tax=Arabidopsis thaliana TaxID=3702 RepID=Q9FXE8_ARATH|nr:F12A21.1 [Arabidopsis thaliana]
MAEKPNHQVMEYEDLSHDVMKTSSHHMRKVKTRGITRKVLDQHMIVTVSRKSLTRGSKQVLCGKLLKFLFAKKLTRVTPLIHKTQHATPFQNLLVD